MAKQKKPVTTVTETVDYEKENVTFTQSFPHDLYTKVFKFKKSIGVSTDQEAVRVICTMFLSKNGF